MATKTTKTRNTKAKAKRVSDAAKMRAFRRGMKDGYDLNALCSPYTNPTLMDQYIHGYQVAYCRRG